MKKYFKLFDCGIVAVSLLAFMLLSACNAKDESAEGDYIAAESVAVTAFSLSPDLRVMRNLDSVFFSIDLREGVIFNADSLPKGTNVTKIVPVISYPPSVTSAKIEMYGGTYKEGVINYMTNPRDTVDFTGNVTLLLEADNGVLSKAYKLKVNVHREDPDTLFWEQNASMKLPSRLENPKSQKSVAFGGGIVSIIEESNSTYTLARSNDIFSANWTKEELTLPFMPVVSTLSECAGELFILDSEGNLYSSASGFTWNRTDEKWINIIGAYNGALMGIVNDSGDLKYTFYPQIYPEGSLPETFPTEGFSTPVEISSRWTEMPSIVITGGKCADGNYTGSSWAFDGNIWAAVSNRELPPLYGPAVVPYFAYLNSSSNGLLKEFNALIAFGGLKEDGTVSDTVCISYDYGITWQVAPENLQLPSFIKTGYLTDGISVSMEMSANLSDRWKVASKRGVKYDVDGDLVKWECPFIFLFGGYDANGALMPEIYSGLLRRLSFVPLF